MTTTQAIIAASMVVILCIVSSKVLYRLGVPTLLIFLGLGVAVSLVYPYYNDFNLTKEICSVGLIFIMFFGGFGTSWKAARPVAVPSLLMSTLGVGVTAGLTGLFCWGVLGTSLLEGLVIGSVLSCTDAASVFAILRSRKLNLKGSIASLLEMESGSNDPFAYLLTAVFTSLMIEGGGGDPIPLMLLKQVGFAVAIGGLLGLGIAWVLRKVSFEIAGLYPIFVLAVGLFAYASCDFLGGNGYLSTYICGIILGNSRIPHKKSLFHFMDGTAWLMQIMIFFCLGLLSVPANFPGVVLPALAIFGFLLLVARPAATFGILSGFRFKIREMLFISWVGLRGASSIVFAIFALTSGAVFEHDIYHMVFFVAALSVALQGTLQPPIAKKLDLVDNETTVLKTFTDYEEEHGTKLLEYPIEAGSRLVGKSIMEANIPEEILIVMIKRGDDVVMPKGSTVLEAGDTLVITSPQILEGDLNLE